MPARAGPRSAALPRPPPGPPKWRTRPPGGAANKILAKILGLRARPKLFPIRPRVFIATSTPWTDPLEVRPSPMSRTTPRLTGSPRPRTGPPALRSRRTGHRGRRCRCPAARRGGRERSAPMGVFMPMNMSMAMLRSGWCGPSGALAWLTVSPVRYWNRSARPSAGSSARPRNDAFQSPPRRDGPPFRPSAARAGELGLRPVPQREIRVRHRAFEMAKLSQPRHYLQRTAGRAPPGR